MGKRDKTAHLLVIRFSALGDVAMSVPVLSALLEEYPTLKLTVVSKPFHRPLFHDISQLDFYSADLKGRHKGLLGLYRLHKELKSLGIDAVADIHGVLRSHILKVFFKMSGVQVVQIDKGRSEKRALTRATNKIFKPLKTTHQRYAEVFGQLGFPIQLADQLKRKKLPLSPKTLNLMGEDKRPMIGVAPFAAHQGKMYPLSKMEHVLRELSETNRYKIFLFGGGEEEKQQLHSIASSLKNVISIVGKLSFEEELQLISNLDLMLSMDSANAHLAANYGVTVVTLWGVTHPYAGFYPYGQKQSNALTADREKFPAIPTSIYGNKMPEGYEKAMETIDGQAIILKIQELLNNQ